MYRFKDLYGTGKHLVINMLEQQGTDESGTYSFFRIPATATSWSYGSYGTISVRDIGYWQGNDAYVTVGGMKVVCMKTIIVSCAFNIMLKQVI